jgi:hypothetical protein
VVLRLECFAALSDGRRLACPPQADAAELCLPDGGGPWSLELIEDEVRRHVDAAPSEALYGPLASALAAAGIVAEAAELAAREPDIELAAGVWERFSPFGERRPHLRAVPQAAAGRATATERELGHLLVYAQHCGEAADRQDRDDIRNSTLAYIGGALTTMLHLGHIDEQQHSDWHERLIKALGEPPGGWKFVGW